MYIKLLEDKEKAGEKYFIWIWYFQQITIQLE